MKNAQRHSKIFIFYDEKHGEQYSESFRKHLKVLEGKADIFDIGKIEAGKKILEAKTAALENADIIILLIDQDLLINDFYRKENINEIISLNKLPMNWKMSLAYSEKTFSFYTGILYYQPNSRIEWINTQHINGISTFEELVALLINTNEVD